MMSIKYFFKLIFWEFKIQLKNPQIFLILIFFNLSLTTIYHFSLKEVVFFDPDNYFGLLLITVFFMVILVSGKSLQREKEAGAYKVILTTVKSRTILFFSRVIVKFSLVIFVLLIFQFIYKILLIGQLFYHQNEVKILLTFFPMIMTLIALGESISLISSGNRLKDLILPALFFPLSIPIFIIYSGLIQKINTNSELNTSLFLLPFITGIIYILAGLIFFINLSIEES